MKITRTSPLSGTNITLNLDISAEDYKALMSKKERPWDHIAPNLSQYERDWIKEGLTLEEWTIKRKADNTPRILTSPQPCVACGAPAHMELRPDILKYKGYKYPVNVLLFKCEQCNTQFSTNEQDEISVNQVYYAHSKEHQPTTKLDVAIKVLVDALQNKASYFESWQGCLSAAAFNALKHYNIKANVLVISVVLKATKDFLNNIIIASKAKNGWVYGKDFEKHPDNENS